MPNWVSNKLVISGENSEEIVKSLLTKDDEGDELNFDFNKIIPMPDELHIISGTVTDRAVALYLTSINPSVRYYGKVTDKMILGRYLELLEKLKAKGKNLNAFDIMTPAEKIAEYEKSVVGEDENFNAGKTVEEAITYGKRAVDNIIKYGHMNWYDWSVANWGTKWNASSTNITGSTIEFETAWSDVSDLMCKLSEKYPDNTFYYDFAEEQAGFYAGEFTYENGEEVAGGYFDEGSKEAYEKYFELWGGEEDYKYDKRTKTYKYIENEAESGGSEM